MNEVSAFFLIVLPITIMLWVGAAAAIRMVYVFIKDELL